MDARVQGTDPLIETGKTRPRAEGAEDAEEKGNVTKNKILNVCTADYIDFVLSFKRSVGESRY